MTIIVTDAIPGFVVTQVSASDADSRPALQFGFIYENSPGMKFAIDQHTGVVTVVEPLDFEETAAYKLRIIVSDSLHQTEAELTIHVVDINDNPPVFTQDLYQVGTWQMDNKHDVFPCMLINSRSACLSLS